MGIAVIVPGVNWSAKNMGQVTLQGNVPVRAIYIEGGDTVVGSRTYRAEFYPVTTTQRTVVWSIISGSEYASISQDGTVTVRSGVTGASVTIRATSSANSSVYADKTITASSGTIIYYDYMQSDGSCRFLLKGGYSFGEDFPAFKLIAKTTYASANGYPFGGQYKNNAVAAKFGTYKRNAGDIAFALGTSNYVATSITPVVGKIYRIEMVFCTGEGISDGTVALYDDSDNTQLFSRSNVQFYLNSDISIFAYGYNQAGAGTTFTVGTDTYSANKLYGLEIYDSSYDKIMDIKPVSLDGTPVLLDEITGEIYYNLGEGTPTLGND